MHAQHRQLNLRRLHAVQSRRSGNGEGWQKTWYFIATDNAFGASLQQETTNFITETGGKVLRSSKYPIGTMDFSAMLVAARSSGADVLGLAVGGTDMINTLKQADEFGVTGPMKVAALVTLLGDIHAAGLQTMQGLLFTNSFYWDLNERTRAFTARVLPRMGGMYPGMTHAGCDGITAHYLKAVAAMGAAAVAQMKALPTDDDAFGPGAIRADGHAVLPPYLLQVKTPAQSEKAWCYCEVVSTMAPQDTVRALDKVGCPLVKI